MGGLLVPTVFPDVLNPPTSGKDNTMTEPGNDTCACQKCDSCSNHASNQRACGHFFCPSCFGCGDPIVSIFNPDTAEWDTVSPDDIAPDDIAPVKITVEGQDSDHVAEIVEAIDNMMFELFDATKSRRVTRTTNETVN